MAFLMQIKEKNYKMNLTPDKNETDFINKVLADYNNKIVEPDHHEPFNIIEYNKIMK
jgi:hypothetical protein